MDDFRDAPVLVTGGRGFVGRWLIAELLGAGVSVAGTCREEDLPEPGENDGVACWRACELTDPGAVRALLSELRPRAVVHLAAQAVPREARRDPLGALQSNYLAVHHLLSAMRESTPGGRLLFASSGEVYGRRARSAPAAREQDPVRPENIYAATKVAAERRLELEAERRGLDVVIARPFNHTGPGRPDRYAESSFARQIVAAELGRGPSEIRVGNLEALRDFSDVRDVVRAYRLLLASGERGHTYNICSGQARSIREVLDLLRGRARVPIRVHVDPGRYEPTPTGREALVGDPTSLLKLGFRPEHPFELTLEALLDHWRELDH